MAKKDSIDIQTGIRLRRLSREQCQTADAMYEQLQGERESREHADDNVADEGRDGRKHAGPVRLNDTFSKLKGLV